MKEKWIVMDKSDNVYPQISNVYLHVIIKIT